MRFNTLSEWLAWQQQLNPREIELGLDRVRQVYQRLQIHPIADTVITVAGTNGKGSSVAYYEGWLKRAGFQVGSYTSPHILNYNERIKINAQEVSDQVLCDAFEQIDQARDDILLTYFEFGTLAAMLIMAQQEVDVAILEVGLGGRLDAVNIVDADLAHITPIGLDHQDWLGETREQIALEKAGILRANGRAVYNDPDPVPALLQRLQDLYCDALVYNRDYVYQPIDEQQIKWTCDNLNISLIPPLQGSHQALNISGVLAGLKSLGKLDGLKETTIVEYFSDVRCAGRLQKIYSSLKASLWVDVGHNEDAARVLSSFLKSQRHQGGRIIVLLGMLQDKNPAAFVQQFTDQVDEWWLMGLDGERGQNVQSLYSKVESLIQVNQQFENADKASDHALCSLGNQDILLVTGSFFSVEAFLKTSCVKKF